ncbi:MAG TPA: hypothetical protein VEK33_03795 [Terriglobales bacterium]|nr:hypothetical protein [Terriglobales bacterium]
MPKITVVKHTQITRAVWSGPMGYVPRIGTRFTTTLEDGSILDGEVLSVTSDEPVADEDSYHVVIRAR